MKAAFFMQQFIIIKEHLFGAWTERKIHALKIHNDAIRNAFVWLTAYGAFMPDCIRERSERYDQEIEFESDNQIGVYNPQTQLVHLDGIGTPFKLHDTVLGVGLTYAAILYAMFQLDGVNEIDLPTDDIFPQIDFFQRPALLPEEVRAWIERIPNEHEMLRSIIEDHGWTFDIDYDLEKKYNLRPMIGHYYKSE